MRTIQSLSEMVLSEGDLRVQYVAVTSALLYRLSRARDLVDVNIAAGIAEDEFEAITERRGKCWASRAPKP